MYNARKVPGFSGIVTACYQMHSHATDEQLKHLDEVTVKEAASEQISR